jgi:hypothetical protein
VCLTLRCDGCGADRTDSSSWSLYPSMRGTRLVPSHHKEETKAGQREHVRGSATRNKAKWPLGKCYGDYASVSLKQIADHTFGTERFVNNSLTFILPSLAPRRLYNNTTQTIHRQRSHLCPLYSIARLHASRQTHSHTTRSPAPHTHSCTSTALPLTNTIRPQPGVCLPVVRPSSCPLPVSSSPPPAVAPPALQYPITF